MGAYYLLETSLVSAEDFKQVDLNPLQPKINCHILYTILFIFPRTDMDNLIDNQKLLK